MPTCDELSPVSAEFSHPRTTAGRPEVLASRRERGLHGRPDIGGRGQQGAEQFRHADGVRLGCPFRLGGHDLGALTDRGVLAGGSTSRPVSPKWLSRSQAASLGWARRAGSR